MNRIIVISPAGSGMNFAVEALNIAFQERAIGGKHIRSEIDEFAKQIANAFHLDTSLIQEIKTSELHQPAQRPLKGGLITLKSETDLGLHFSSIEQGLITLKHQMHVLPHKTGHLQ